MKIPRLSDDEDAARAFAKITGITLDKAMGWVHVTEGNITAAKDLLIQGQKLQIWNYFHLG